MNNQSLEQFIRDNLRDGETYAGIILGKDGANSYHLVLLPAVPCYKLNWDDAKKWSESINAELPNRREQALLFANCKEQFEVAWYWSCEQYAASPCCAWVQHFDDGGQLSTHKSFSCRVRAVRRVYL